jgi:hypothetical protein
VVRRIDQLNLHERTLLQKTERRVENWLVGYLAVLNAAFYRNFVNRWDLGDAHRNGVIQDLSSDAHESLAAAADDVTDDMQSVMVDAYQDGYAMAAFDMYRGGLATADQLEEQLDPPTPEHVHHWGRNAAIAGVALAARIRRWMGDTTVRNRLVLNAAAGQGSTLPETQLQIETLGEQLANRLGTLGTAELQRAFYAGQRLALTQLFGDVVPAALQGDLWLTRRDNKVCPICWALHGTITTLEPVDDTHPGCRCVKVPLLDLDSTGFRDYDALPFAAFKEWLFG